MGVLLCCRGRPACTTGSLAQQKSSGDARQLTPLCRVQRLQFGHAGSSKFHANRTLPVTPAVSDARLSNRTILFSAYEIFGHSRGSRRLPRKSIGAFYS
jgi:hypothetical protein